MPEREKNISVGADEDLSDKILRALAEMHPRRPTRSELIARMESGETADSRKMATAKRLGWLVTNKYIEETLNINNNSPRIGLPGTALIGIVLNIEILRRIGKTQHMIVDEILEKTKEFIRDNIGISAIPSIVIREISIVHGSDQFDILLTVLHSHEIVSGKGSEEPESILTYYVRDVLQARVEGVAGTRSMTLASSRAYPMHQLSGNRGRKPSGSSR